MLTDRWPDPLDGPAAVVVWLARYVVADVALETLATRPPTHRDSARAVAEGRWGGRSGVALTRQADRGNVVTRHMPPRPRAPRLGEFELLVLLAALGLRDDAYPFAIARDIETRTGREVSRAAVLITLERLEEKDLVKSRYGGATSERGGRPKRIFQVKPRGIQAVRESLDQISTMAAGLEPVLRRR